MNIYHLKYFRDAVELDSLAKSAKTNNVSPGAISQAITKLEQLFGQKLLYHQKNSLELTEMGKKLHLKLKPFLQEYESIFSEISTGETMSGEFFFITQQSIAEYILPKTISIFKNKYPAILPRMTLGNTTIAKDRLSDKTVDFAITLDNVDLSGFEKKVIRTGNFVLYKSKKYKLASDYFLVTGETPEVRFFKELYLKKNSRPANISMEISSWGVLKKMANEGNGIALIPDYLVSKVEEKYILKDIKLSKYKIVLAWQKNRDLSKKILSFMEEL